MISPENIYDIIEDQSETGIKFFFISRGERDVIKVVEYSFVQELYGRRIFNIGFGDYDIKRNTVIDDVNSNNGDIYKVFNTVLHTIPRFFKQYKNDVLMIRGSDSKLEYSIECKETCKKKCVDYCKNYHRRMNIYCGYLEKNYDNLISEYEFLGELMIADNHSFIEEYARKKKYDAVFLLKKVIL